MVLADLRRKGFEVAIPFGHDVPFDLILFRKETGTLEKVQVKSTAADGNVVIVECPSNSDWVSYAYRADQVDWIAVYDATTNCCYYVHSSLFAGMYELNLRLTPVVNGERKNIRWARDHIAPNRMAPGPSLPFTAPPE